MTTIDDLHTFHASGKALTDESGIALRSFVIVTPLALELSITGFATSPGLFRIDGRNLQHLHSFEHRFSSWWS